VKETGPPLPEGEGWGEGPRTHTQTTPQRIHRHTPTRPYRTYVPTIGPTTTSSNRSFSHVRYHPRPRLPPLRQQVQQPTPRPQPQSHPQPTPALRHQRTEVHPVPGHPLPRPHRRTLRPHQRRHPRTRLRPRRRPD
ncbi:MAG: hypothetical protein F4Y35_13985, partial [Chloroflexi bacterium]|nr:hypothetical protein [Chloroflexota bacterium]